MSVLAADIWWLIGIMFGGATITLGLWQLGLIVPFAVIDLCVLSFWCAFAAALSGYMGMRIATMMTGAGLIPLAAAFMVITQLSNTEVQTVTANIAGGLFIATIFAHLIIWAVVTDRLDEHKYAGSAA